MKLSLSLVTLLVGISVATPLAASSKKSGAPGPPSSTFKKVKQQCSAKQSSIRCCNLDSKGGSKSSKSNVKHGGDNFNLSCQEFSGDDNTIVSNLCSTTVACCIGDGCVAIAN